MTALDCSVQARNIHQAFGSGDKRVEVLKGIDLSIAKASLVALYGPSGSGKTTLLNILGSLDRPTSGEVYLEGTPLQELADKQLRQLRRERLGLIFQNSALISSYTVRENIDMNLRMANVPYHKRRHKIDTILQQLGLGPWHQHLPAQLSGGQRQRVAIARALVNQPGIVFADEPTSALDSLTTKRVLELFTEYARLHDTTFIIVSHDPLVTEYVMTAFDLYQGKITQRASGEKTHV